MGFRGIDPYGLDELSVRTAIATAEVTTATGPACHVLGRHGYGDDAAAAQKLSNRIGLWGADTVAALHRRAELIRSGQKAPGDTPAILGAEFAIEGLFTLPEMETAFEAWRESRQRAERAVGDITGWLDQSWNDWDVSNNDLQNIANTLEDLTSKELDGVISALSPRQLERWIGEMGNGFNGFSREEKQALFANLAAADGESLGKIHDALLRAGSERDIVHFGLAIQHHGADGAIVAFVGHVMNTDLAATRYSTVAPVLALSGIENADAVAAATRAIVDVEGALETTIVDSLVTAHVEDTGVACIEIDPLDSLVTAASRTSDVEVTTAVFAAVAGAATDRSRTLLELLSRRYDVVDTAPGWIDRKTGGDSGNELLRSNETKFLDSAVRLLVSDADGVITELATEIDPGGLITTDFLYELVDHGRGDNIGRIAHELRGGDVVDPARFGEVGDIASYRYAHAQNLAYLAGTTTNALERYADDAQSTIDAIGHIAGIAMFATGTIFKVASFTLSAAGAATEYGATDWKGSRVQDNIDEYLDTLLADVEEAFRPDTDGTGVPIPGEAWENWTEQLTRIKSIG